MEPSTQVLLITSKVQKLPTKKINSPLNKTACIFRPIFSVVLFLLSVSLLRHNRSRRFFISASISKMLPLLVFVCFWNKKKGCFLTLFRLQAITTKANCRCLDRQYECLTLSVVNLRDIGPSSSVLEFELGAQWHNSRFLINALVWWTLYQRQYAVSNGHRNQAGLFECSCGNDGLEENVFLWRAVNSSQRWDFFRKNDVGHASCYLTSSTTVYF